MFEINKYEMPLNGIVSSIETTSGQLVSNESNPRFGMIEVSIVSDNGETLLVEVNEIDAPIDGFGRQCRLAGKSRGDRVTGLNSRSKGVEIDGFGDLVASSDLLVMVNSAGYCQSVSLVF